MRRVDGTADAVDTPIGRVPAPGALNTDGMDLNAAELASLFEVDRDSWLQEAELTQEYFEIFDGRVPAPVEAELVKLKERLRA
jgi:phosphoenolpyruvate carboxykinase (GTP)